MKKMPPLKTGGIFFRGILKTINKLRYKTSQYEVK
jgi:hypothetical protein